MVIEETNTYDFNDRLDHGNENFEEDFTNGFDNNECRD